MYDVIVVGAGAAGLMAAISAGKNGKKVLLVEHTSKIGEKIRISGGGRCNFTNINTTSANFLSRNPHFVKSALSQYTQHDFISMVEAYGIAYHEKTLGQLFCDGSSKQIIDMLIDMCNKAKVQIELSCEITDIVKNESFIVQSNQGVFSSNNLIIATGGLSIPKIGASDFGYRIAKKFCLNIINTRPALVPLIVSEGQKDLFLDLRGVSNFATVHYNKTSFSEGLLFTHKGLSGPSILQISSYLEKFEDEKISIDLLPKINLKDLFVADKNSKQTVTNYLKAYLTNRLVDNLALLNPDFNKSITDLSKNRLQDIAYLIHNFDAFISGSEGYLKAEVTAGGVDTQELAGGVDTQELSSKTMESKKVPGLFFVGEVMDVTGWLGGYNFQWAWSSGFAAGNAIASF
ncbi:MAG: NAD(P)/FAD-dependent oxidoreductase [Rickettsiaceae bacterium]|nr:NAD(P)/FAD-dependent oxidoreductase [Rickettsiaceae bacterium]